MSPQNILVGFDGTVKVVDFGIAYALERLESTRTGIIKGKLSYMAPEQLTSRDVDRRSDVFALGIVLFEAVLLRRLFRGQSDPEVAARIVEGDVPAPRRLDPDLPTGVERILLRALALQPEARYQTAGDLAEALNLELLHHKRVVGPRQLAEMMDRLFHDKRRLMDEQIRIAIQRAPARPLIALGVSELEEVSRDTVPLPVPSRFRGWWVVGGAAFVVAAALIFVIRLNARQERSTSVRQSLAARGRTRAAVPGATGTDAATTLASPPRTRAARSQPPPARLVRIQLDIQPPLDRTVVTFRGRSYRGPSFQAALPATGRKEIIEIRARGYKKKRIVVKLNSDHRQRIQLRPRVRWRPRRPRRPRRPQHTGPTDYSMYVKMP